MRFDVSKLRAVLEMTHVARDMARRMAHGLLRRMASDVPASLLCHLLGDMAAGVMQDAPE